MNMHLHRKQIVILVLAMALAAASYWIPLPRQPEAQPTPARLFGPIDQTMLEEAIVYAREPATSWRFPVTARAPQTPVQTVGELSTENVKPALPEPRLINQQDFSTDDRMPAGYPRLAPVRGLDLSPKR